MTTPTVKRESVTQAQAAEQIGVSERTILRMLKRGELQGYRVTLVGVHRIYADSVKAFLKEREIKPEQK